MHNFLSQNVWIFPLYILLTRRIDSFWSGGIETFGLGVWKHLGLKNHTRKIDKTMPIVSLILSNTLFSI